ncbi:hypothetical protein [Kitasatospora sp. NPDC058046]|uniref:hypothetical protein n=1 Tax=Kitasatospora sp. NPDC058046 TaxID=3346312 RepID=UPI0036DB9ADC
MLTTGSRAQAVTPDDVEPVELAPEHLRLLRQLAASRAARQAGPSAQAQPTAPAQAGADDLVQEIERLRTYVAVLEAAVTLLLESTPISREVNPPAPG